MSEIQFYQQMYILIYSYSIGAALMLVPLFQLFCLFVILPIWVLGSVTWMLML